MQSAENKTTPEQREGISKDLDHHIDLPDKEQAAELFLLAKERLLDVNHWHEVSKTLKTRFRIKDGHLHGVDRPVHKGDYIQVDTPGPGLITGDGNDWVQAEELVYDDYPDADKEAISLRLRPSPPPGVPGGTVSHFFSATATSSFIVERQGNRVAARYRGRNEKPNMDADTVTDTIRNTAVALGAMLGLSDIQWDGLIRGFLEPQEQMG